jgi:hypothetical protein
MDESSRTAVADAPLKSGLPVKRVRLGLCIMAFAELGSVVLQHPGLILLKPDILISPSLV